MRISAGMWIVYMLFFMLTAGACYAQRPAERPPARDQPINVDKETPTHVLDKDARFKPDARRPKSRKIRYIVKKKTNGLLMGNKCATDATHRMGFEYIVQAKGQPGYKNGFQRFWGNLGVKTLLFFTRGPWWKLTIKKRIKRCKYQTGDYTG